MVSNKSNWVIAFLTLALVIVTVIYTSHTKEMANTMKEQFNLSYQQFQQNNRPFLFISKANFIFKDNKLSYIIYLKNRGNIPARVKVKKWSLIIDDQEYILDLRKDFHSTFIFPNQDNLNIIFEPQKGVIDLGISKGMFTITSIINYWSIEDKKLENTYTYEEKISFFKTSEDIKSWGQDIIYINAN